MKDPFPPARAAGCRAMVENADQYAPRDLASRVLPATCALLVDPDKTVRETGFSAVQKFVSILEDISNDPDKAEKLNPQAAKPAQNSSSATSAQSSSNSAPQGWAGYLASSAVNLTMSAASTAASAASSKVFSCFKIKKKIIFD